MSPALKAFLGGRYVRQPLAVSPVAAIVRDFRETLPAAERHEWTRQRLVSELLAAGYVCGVRDKVYHVAGIAPRGSWQEVQGKLELVHA